MRPLSSVLLAAVAAPLALAYGCGLDASGLVTTATSGVRDGGTTLPTLPDASRPDTAVPGACQPGTCPPVALANAQNDPRAVAIDALDVFWVNFGSPTASPSFSDGSVMRASKDGSSVAAMFARPEMLYRGPSSITVAGGAVVWGCSQGGAIMRSDPLGATPVTVSVGQLAPAGVAFDPSTGDLFWTNGGDSVRSIIRQPGGGGPQGVVASDARGASAIVLDADHVYWAASVDNSVKRVKRDGTCDGKTCPEVLLAPRGVPEAAVRIAVDGANVYATNADDGHVTQVAVDAASSTDPSAVVLASQPHAMGLALDEEYVYFVTYSASGEVWRARKDGSGSEALAHGQAWPHAIAVDATAVYWVNRGTQTAASGDVHDAHDGQVMRLAR